MEWVLRSDWLVAETSAQKTGGAQESHTQRFTMDRRVLLAVAVAAVALLVLPGA